MADGEPTVADSNPEKGRRRLHLRSLIEGESSENDFEAPAYEGIGIELKVARERFGVPRPEFASRLRIREPYISAIEEGRFSDLPGPVYAVGFIRSYADSVGLDGEGLVDRFKRETAAGPDQTQLRFPAPEAESRLPSARLLAVSVLLVGAVYGGWYYLSNTDRSEVEQIPAVPKRLLANDTSSAGPADLGLATVGSSVERDTQLKPSKPAKPPLRTLVETGAASTVITDDESSDATLAVEQIRSAAPVLTSAVGAASASPEVVEAAVATTPEITTSAAGQPQAVERLPDALPQGNIQVVVISPSGAVSSETANAVEIQASVDESSLPPLPESSGDISVPETEIEVTAPSNQQQRRGRERPSDDRPSGGIAEADNEISETALPTAILDTDEAPLVQRVYGNGTDKSRVILTARLDSWVQVVTEENELLLTRILRAGDTYFVPNRLGLKLLTGNAGALEVTLDGRALPPIGPAGAVRRNVSLDPEHLLSAARQAE